MSGTTPKNCLECEGSLQARRLIKAFRNEEYGHEFCPRCGITFDDNVNDLIDISLSAEDLQAIDDDRVHRKLFVETSKISDEEGTIYPRFAWDDNDALKVGLANRIIRSIEENHQGDLQTLVDLGCGDGFTSVKLAERYPGVKVFAIDPSPLVLRLAEHQGVVPVRGTLQTADLEDRSTDILVIFGNWMLHTDPFETLREGHRILRENGTLILDFKNVRSAARVLAKVALRLGVDRWGGRGYLERNFLNMRFGMHKDFVRRQVEAQGFQVVRMFDKPPRLLEFKNASVYQQGLTGWLWRILHGIDRMRGEQAWVQVSARKL